MWSCWYPLLSLLVLSIWPSTVWAASPPLVPTNGSAQIFTSADCISGGLGSIHIRTDLPHLECEEDYFLATEENWIDSGAGEAYVDWMKCVDKESDAWRLRKSEPDFFMKTVPQFPDNVECSVELKGCQNIPSCGDILSRVRDKHFTRQIMFIFDSFHNAYRISGTVKVSLLCLL